MFCLGCTHDHYAYIWNTSPYAPREPVFKLNGHQKSVTCVDWCKNDLKLATSSGKPQICFMWISTTIHLEYIQKIGHNILVPGSLAI